MRVAVSGAHQTGKTTLIQEVVRRLPQYAAIDEPYYQLLDEGHVFGQPPSREDFEAQLERSIESVTETEDNRILDRCPADFFAYLLTDRHGFDVEPWLDSVRRAMGKLDLIIFTPIERPDRIAPSDRRGMRRRVDEELRSILIDDCWDLGSNVLEVTGTPAERAVQVMERVG